jgi:short-subunit dehydrogenase/CheY-like chemotaxis protein
LEACVPERPLVAIVDDDESIRQTTLDLLESAGFSAVAFASAETFLSSGRLKRYGCLIADVRMPGMSGLDLHQKLVASSCSIPTIIITAYTDERARAHTARSNVVRCLAKPFVAEELLACVGSAVGRRQGDGGTQKVAVITGATGGIGLAVATHAVARGMKVALVDRDQARLTVGLEQLSGNGAGTVAAYVDTGDLTELRTLARRIELELGPPWLVCNHYDTGVELNLRAVIHAVEVFAPVLAERGEGHIVNIISADDSGTRRPAAYAAAMHAIVGLSETLYRELDSLQSLVGVSLVSPTHDHGSRILAREHRNGDSYPVSRAADVVPPERLAEEIFAAIATRRFQLFSDRLGIRAPV